MSSREFKDKSLEEEDKRNDEDYRDSCTNNLQEQIKINGKMIDILHNDVSDLQTAVFLIAKSLTKHPDEYEVLRLNKIKKLVRVE